MLATRFSADLDIFRDRQERVAEAALADTKALSEAGYQVAWLRQQPAAYSATVPMGAGETRLEWVADSDHRFFPVVGDDRFGYVLLGVDLTINKAMAAASRREPRDIVDLVMLHERVPSTGAPVWAAVEIAPRFTPEGLITEIRRNARYPAQESRQLAADPPIDPDDVMRRLRTALDEAEAIVASMPREKAGLLLLRA